MGRKATTFLMVMAALVMVSGTAFALTYTNSKKVSLKLNKPNYVGTALTKLASNAVGPALTLGTDSNDPTATPLRLQTETGSQPPMAVNSETRVDNLTADKLDGKSSEEFASSSHSHDDRYFTETESDGRYASRVHTHSGSDITSGTVAEARIDGTIARDSEVSNGFIQGRGTAQHRALALNPGSNLWFWELGNAPISLSNPPLSLSYNCPSDLSSNGFIGIKNASQNSSPAETVNVFSDNGSTNPDYRQLPPIVQESFWSQGAAATGEHIIFQVQGNAYVATIEVFSVHRTNALNTGTDNKCHVQAHALITRP